MDNHLRAHSIDVFAVAFLVLFLKPYKAWQITFGSMKRQKLTLSYLTMTAYFCRVMMPGLRRRAKSLAARQKCPYHLPSKKLS
jgi:hypothetical protein